MVLVAVLVAVGEGNDGYRVDGLYQGPLGQGLCHNFTTVVRHAVPREDTEEEGVRVIGEIPFLGQNVAQLNCRSIQQCAA